VEYSFEEVFYTRGILEFRCFLLLMIGEIIETLSKQRIKVIHESFLEEELSKILRYEIRL
jgi:hypothetical protein